MRRSNRRVGAFTLVELMIVMGVVAMLVAMLIPAVHWGTRRARIISCINNLKTIHTGLIQYTTQYGDFLPAAGGGDFQNDQWYRVMMGRISEQTGIYQPGQIGSWEVYKCPGKYFFQEDVDRRDGTDKMAMVHYAMNCTVRKRKGNQLMLWERTVQLQNFKTAQTVIVADTGEMTGGSDDDPLTWVESKDSAESGACYFPEENGQYSGPWRPSNRHDDRTNVLFLSGAAKIIDTVELVRNRYGRPGCLFDNQ